MSRSLKVRLEALSGVLALLTGAAVHGAPVAVQTVVASPSGGGSITVSSNLMVDRDVSVSSRVDGVIDSIQVDRGAIVRADQPLATLDQREFQLDRRAAEENFQVSQADYRRYQELYKQKLASQAELEQREARFESAKVALAKAKLVIDRSVIRAPFAGVVVDRFAKVGQRVLVDDNTPLFKISALGPLLARIYLAEALLAQVRVGETVRVQASQFPSVTSSGKLKFVSPVLDPASGSFQAVVEVARDPARVLRPGMGVRIVLSLRGGFGTSVPDDCLIEGVAAGGGGTGTVFEVDGGHLRRRHIRYTALDGGALLVTSGLARGARVVRNPSPDLREGEAVQTGK
jgi:membrane fusion protein (multidrug efflux system)